MSLYAYLEKLLPYGHLPVGNFILSNDQVDEVFLFTEDFRTILRSLALMTITLQRSPVLWIILSGAILLHCSTHTARVGSTEIMVLTSPTQQPNLRKVL